MTFADPPKLTSVEEMMAKVEAHLSGLPAAVRSRATAALTIELLYSIESLDHRERRRLTDLALQIQSQDAIIDTFEEILRLNKLYPKYSVESIMKEMAEMLDAARNRKCRLMRNAIGIIEIPHDYKESST